MAAALISSVTDKDPVPVSDILKNCGLLRKIQSEPQHKSFLLLDAILTLDAVGSGRKYLPNRSGAARRYEEAKRRVLAYVGKVAKEKTDIMLGNLRGMRNIHPISAFQELYRYLSANKYFEDKK